VSCVVCLCVFLCSPEIRVESTDVDIAQPSQTNAMYNNNNNNNNDNNDNDNNARTASDDNITAAVPG